jgi:hypothetical protein
MKNSLILGGYWDRAAGIYKKNKIKNKTNIVNNHKEVKITYCLFYF